MWLADRHSDQELYTAAKHCAKIHLVQLQQTDEFLNLPLCLLMDIIKGNDWFLAWFDLHSNGGGGNLPHHHIYLPSWVMPLRPFCQALTVLPFSRWCSNLSEPQGSHPVLDQPQQGGERRVLHCSPGEPQGTVFSFYNPKLHCKVSLIFLSDG